MHFASWRSIAPKYLKSVCCVLTAFIETPPLICPRQMFVILSSHRFLLNHTTCHLPDLSMERSTTELLSEEFAKRAILQCTKDFISQLGEIRHFKCSLFVHFSTVDRVCQAKWVRLQGKISCVTCHLVCARTKVNTVRILPVLPKVAFIIDHFDLMIERRGGRLWIGQDGGIKVVAVEGRCFHMPETRMGMNQWSKCRDGWGDKESGDTDHICRLLFQSSDRNGTVSALAALLREHWSLHKKDKMLKDPTQMSFTVACEFFSRYPNEAWAKINLSAAQCLTNWMRVMQNKIR